MEYLQDTTFLGLALLYWIIAAVALVAIIAIIIIICCVVSANKKKAKTEEPAVQPKQEVKSEPAKEEPAKAAPAKKEEPKKEEKPAAKPSTTKKEEKPAAKPAPAKKEEPAKPTTKTYHISKRKDDNMWQIKAAGGSRAIKLFKTQKEAIDYCKTLADNQDANIMIHKEDGSFRKLTY